MYNYFFLCRDKSKFSSQDYDNIFTISTPGSGKVICDFSRPVFKKKDEKSEGGEPSGTERSQSPVGSRSAK